MLISTNKNATLRYRTLDSQFCSEAWSSIGDIVSVYERSLLKITAIWRDNLQTARP